MVKRIFACVLAAFLLVGWTPAAANAAGMVTGGSCGDDLGWTLDTDGLLTISGTGPMDDWSLLKQETPWYGYRNRITALHIMEGVTTIGEAAFASLGNLTEVTLPESLTGIGTHAFGWCSSLTEITLPSGVAKLGTYVFSNCDMLTDIHVSPENKYFCDVDGILYSKDITALVAWPNGRGNGPIQDTVKTIKTSAFRSCHKLTELVIPASVEKVEAYAIGDCNSLQSITIEKDPEFKGGTSDALFGECRKLENISAGPASTKYASVDGVLYSKDLDVLLICPAAKKYVSILDSVTEIGPYAFAECGSLTDIRLSASVNTIGKGAFYFCTDLNSLVIPEGVKQIGGSTFAGCYALSRLELPASLVSIGNAFYSCSSLGHVLYRGTKAQWADISKGTANFPAAARFVYNYSLGDPVHTYSDENDSSCNICGQLRLTGCPGEPLTVEIATNYNYDYAPEAEAPAMVFAAKNIFSDGSESRYVKGYTLSFSAPGTYEVVLVQETTEKTHRVFVVIGEHSWIEATCAAPRTCADCSATEGGTLDHTYSHEYDYKCDICGTEREVDMTRPMVDMFRMYNPNTGEHFYTGSTEERDNLIGHGWQYEGVGFTFPLTTGDPVHRLFDPNTGEHLYTMDVNEKETLMAAGWNYEGIAFNSGFENEVPQYRLHNPNATVGAYHFTASAEERDTLLAAGWEYQGIGWYSLGSMN